jgi:TrwC relaxase
VTAVVTAASGYDLGYVWHNQASKEAGQGTEREQDRDRAGYYMQKGEPAGRWFGRGAEALGFEEGQEIEREPDSGALRTRPPQGRRHARP